MAQEREGYDEEFMRITALYVEEVEAGRHPRLSDYIRQHPHYATALIDFVAYYHTFEIQLSHIEDVKEGTQHTGNGEHTRLSPITQTALPVARRRVYASSQQQPSQAITTLFTLDEDKPPQLERLAQHLYLSKDMVMLLEQHRLHASSIPLALQRRLALWLQQPVSAIQSFFLIAEEKEQWTSYEPGVRVAEKPLSYPEVPRQHFLQALEESSEATAEQRAFWRECVEREQKDMR